MLFVPRMRYSIHLKLSAMILLLIAGLMQTGGCSYLVPVVQPFVPTNEDAAYKDLHNQTVGIMVWAGQGITIDHPEIQSDVSKGLQRKLIEAKTDEVKGIQWMKADDILHFQEDHPELSTEPAENLATRLPVTRLIYIEISSLSLHPNDAVDLNRGDVMIHLKVIEVKNGVTKIGYQDNNIEVIYPKNSPPEGVMGLEEDEVYRQTIDSVTTELAKLFITHEADSE